MTPIQETRTLYTFAELNPDAQARAIESYRNRHAEWLGTDWDDEWAASRAAIQNLFESAGFTLDFNRNGDPLSVEDPGDYYGHEPMRGIRLWKYLREHTASAIQWGPHDSKEERATRERYDSNAKDGDARICPFTGYCGDEDYLAPLRQFLARPDTRTDSEDIVRACFTEGDEAWEMDREYAGSDEGIRESIEADDIEPEWLEEGKYA